MQAHEELSIRLKGELSFETAQWHQQQLQHAIQKRGCVGVRVDLAKVEYSDSAGLALLIDALRLAKHWNKTVIFCDPPPQMVALAKFCGVDSLLWLDEIQK